MPALARSQEIEGSMVVVRWNRRVVETVEVVSVEEGGGEVGMGGK